MGGNWLTPRRQRQCCLLAVGQFSAPTLSSQSASPTPVKRVLLHLEEDATGYTDAFTIERTIITRSGDVHVPIFRSDKPDAEPRQVPDGAVL